MNDPVALNLRARSMDDESLLLQSCINDTWMKYIFEHLLLITLSVVDNLLAVVLELVAGTSLVAMTVNSRHKTADKSTRS